MVRDLIRATLESEGYELLIVESGEAALALCRSRNTPIHLAILDIVMPGMNGVDLLNCLRRLYPNVRAILISGYLEDEALQKVGLSLDDARFLAKPFTPSQLRKRIKEELIGYRSDAAR